MPLVRNFPFFSIFLAIVSGIVCLTLGGRAAKWLTFACLSALTALSAALLAFTLRTGESFTYMMGHFPAPFGNEIRAGAFEAFMALLFCSVSLLSVAGGLRDIFDDLPAKKINLYLLMQNMLTGAMLAIIYTNDIFTAFVFIEIIIIAACPSSTKQTIPETIAKKILKNGKFCSNGITFPPLPVKPSG